MLVRVVGELTLWALSAGAAWLVAHEAALTVAAKLSEVTRALGAM